MRNRTLAMSGSRLTEAEVLSLEKRVEHDPQDIDSRLKLLGYYFRKQLEDPSAKKAHEENIVWLIQNKPELDILATPFGILYEKMNVSGYARGRDAWLDQLKTDPENLKFLEHSAKYFTLFDPELAEESLLKGQVLESHNPKWPAELGELKALEVKKLTGDAAQIVAKKALAQFEIAYRHSGEMGQDRLLAQLAEVALIAHEHGKALEYAKIMLSKDDSHENAGNNIHYGNITLGKIAIAADDVEAAKQYLINAGNTSGSPQLNSFGPDRELAQALLQEGAKETVLEYLTLCSKFWKSGQDRLADWIEMIQKNQTPTDW